MSHTTRYRSWSERLLWGAGPYLVRGICRIVWRLEIEAEEGFPKPPFVVAANHHSFLDAILIGAAFGTKIRFLALQGLFGHYRWVDLALRAFDVIPLRRGVVPLGPVREALNHVHEGGAVGLFPEGTRHWDFDPRRAKHGAAWLATRAKVPLIPVALQGTQQVLGVDNRLRSGRVKITVGSPLRGDADSRPEVERLTSRWADWLATTLSQR